MPKPDAHILPGLKPVQELLRKAPDRIVRLYARKDIPPSILKLAETRAIPVEITDGRTLDQLCRRQGSGPGISHQGIAAELRGPNLATLGNLLTAAPAAPLPLILALDQIRDPGNLGSLARLAWAMGCAGLLLPEHNSCPPGPAAFRTSAGALALLPVCETTNLARALDEAAEQGFAIYGAAACANAENVYCLDWQMPAILTLGSENRGLRPGVAKRCESMVAIPLSRGFDSLNVAQAGAILTSFCAACHARKSMQTLSE
ncbi:MAG: RNA methyltransferase [Desulfovibrio sp.]|nr:RNA methyltransferase [Desulfovibrio sp.]